LSGCIFTTKAHISSRKKLLNSIMSYTCLHNMANFGPLTAEIGSGVWGTPANFTGFASCLRYGSDVSHRRPTKLRTMFGRLFGWYTVYIIFEGSWPLTEFCPVQNSLYVQVLRSPVLAALLHGTPAAGISRTLRRCTFADGATYIQQGGHHVGHGPHSS